MSSSEVESEAITMIFVVLENTELSVFTHDSCCCHHRAVLVPVYCESQGQAVYTLHLHTPIHSELMLSLQLQPHGLCKRLDPCWPQWYTLVHRNIMEPHGIPWNSIEQALNGSLRGGARG
jgi:hypothetical protein